METVVAQGVSEIIKLGSVTTILSLVILCLIWFIRELLKDARAERALNRQALTNSTEVIAELKELIRNALHR